MLDRITPLANIDLNGGIHKQNELNKIVFLMQYYYFLQYFGHLMRRVDSLEKTLMMGGIGAEGDSRG